MDPTIDPEVSAEEPVEEPGNEVVTGMQTNAAEKTTAIVGVTYIQITQNDKGEDQESSGSSDQAAVHYTQGSVNSDNTLVKGRALTFKVEPAAGRVLTYVGYKIGADITDDKKEPADAGGVDAGKEYNIGTDKFVTKVEGVDTAQNVQIIVKTKAAGHKVTIEKGGTVKDYKVYSVEANNTIDTTKEYADDTVITYEDSKQFAIVPNDDANIVLESVKQGDKNPITFGDLTKLNVKDSTPAATKDGYVFTVNPSTYAEIGMNAAEEAITVTATAREKYELTVNAVSVAVGEAEAIGSVDNKDDKTYIAYSDDKFGTDSKFIEGSEDLGKSLAFRVNPKAKYEVTGVTATLNKGKKGEAVLENAVSMTEKKNDKGASSYECTFALSQITLTENVDLTFEVKTTLDGAQTDAVHTIKFKADKGDLKNVEIKNGSTVLDLTGSEGSKLTDEVSAYKITVAPKEGYELSKGAEADGDALKDKQYVTITETRKFKTEADTEADSYSGSFSYVRKEAISKEVDGKETAAEITLNLKGTDEHWKEWGKDDTATNAEFITTGVQVSLSVDAAFNEDERIVYFDDKLGGEDKNYKITNTSGVVLDDTVTDKDKKNDTWAIAKGENLLTFTVTSDKEPTVMLNGTKVSSEGESEGNVYSYSIPTSILTETTNTISLTKEDAAVQDVKIKVEGNDLEDNNGITYKVNENRYEFTIGDLGAKDENGYYAIPADRKPRAGQTIELTFKVKPGVTFGEVTYAMGEQKGTAEIDEEDGTATLTIPVTDAVTIDVNTTSNYSVVLSKAGRSLENKNGVYTADYDESNITVELHERGKKAKVAFYDIVLKDGGDIAATPVTLASDKESATIGAIDSSEWGRTLTVEVYKSRTEMYSVALQVSAASDTVTVIDMTTGKVVKKDETVSLMADSKISFKVEPAEGANYRDLAVELRPVDGTDKAKAQGLFIDGDKINIDSKGIVTLQTKPSAKAEGQVLLCVYKTKADKDGKTSTDALAGGEITLNLTEPLVNSGEIKKITAKAASSTNRDVSLDLNLEFKSKNMPKAPVENDLYYKVELGSITPSASVDGLKTFTSVVVYEPIYRDGESYSKADLVKNVRERLVEEYKVADNPNAYDIPATISATAKVTLVQALTSKVGHPDVDQAALVENTDYVVCTNDACKLDVPLTTKMPVYETKLKIKNVNGATVITGQRDVIVATPVFDKNTSYINDITLQFVDTKTGVTWSADGDGSSSDDPAAYDGSGSFTAWVGDDNAVHVSASSSVHVTDSSWKNALKTLGIKVIAASADGDYAATAVVKLKVKQGIFSVAVDESKARLTENLYQAPNGTVKSVKIATVLNKYSGTIYKPAKSTLNWTITDEDGTPVTDERCELDENIKSAYTQKKIAVKNGTISVNKKYTRAATKKNADADTFYVMAQANDFANNYAEFYEPVKFTITGENQTFSSMVVVNDAGEAKDLATLKATDFKADNLYIAAVKEDKKKYNDADYIPVTFKANNKNVSLALESDNTAGINLLKPGKVKITATTVDGGKGSGTKLTKELNIASYDMLGLELTRSDGIITGPDANAAGIRYAGGNNERYTLKLQYHNGSKWQDEDEYKNVKVAVTNGKFIARKEWAKDTIHDGSNMGTVVVVNKRNPATIKLTDTATKKVVATYTITNDSFKTTAAPSISLVNKVSADDKTFTWKLKKDTDKYAGMYVKLTPDFTVAESTNGTLDAYKFLGTDSKSNYSGVICKIDEDGEFTYTRKSNLSSYKNYGGTVKLVATIGKLVKGEFYAEVKDVKLTFKLNKAKYNTNLQVTGSYKLNAAAGASAQIVVKTDKSYRISDAMDVTKKQQYADDHSNNFTRYFKVYNNEWPLNNAEKEYAYIGLRDDLSVEDIAYITGESGDKEQKKAAKADCVGYITVSNGDYQKDVQIKISFAKVAYKATAPAVYANTKAAVKVPVTVMSGKTSVAVTDAILDGTNDFTTVKPEVIDGVLTLTSNNPIAANKKYVVNLKVLPENTAYSVDMKLLKDEKDTSKLTKDALLSTYGVPVTVNIEVKELVAKNAAKLAKTSFTLSSKAYEAENGNGYVQAIASGMGVYRIDVPYTLAGENLSIKNKAATDVTVGLEGNNITIDGKPEALITAAADVVTVYDSKRDEYTDQPVIKLEVSKKVLKAMHDQAKADSTFKPVADWGKKNLSVPVSVIYTNGNDEIPAELSVKLTFPKEPTMTLADAEKTLKDEKSGIGKIKTTGNTTAVILQSLTDKIESKAKALIPADADIRVESIVLKTAKTEEDKDDTDLGDPALIMERGTADATLTLKDLNATTNNTATPSWSYDLGIHASYADSEAQDIVYEVARAIDALNDLTLDNSTTQKGLENEIINHKDMASHLSAKKANISVKVTSFILKPSTEAANNSTGGTGSINATVTVRNLLTGKSTTASIYKNDITAYNNINNAYNAVTTKIDNDFVQKALQDCAGNDSNARDEVIKKEAEKLVNNPAITVSIENWKYKAVSDKENGTLTFTIKLTKNGRVKEQDYEVTILQTEFTKYGKIADAKQKILDAIAVVDAEDKSKYTFETTLAGSFVGQEEAKIKELILKEAYKVVGDPEDAEAGVQIYGFEVSIDKESFKLEKATATKKATVACNLTVSAKVGTDIAKITISPTGFGDEDATNMTPEELDKEIDKVLTIEGAALPADETAAITEIEKKLPDLAAQTVTFKGATWNVVQKEGSTATKDDNGVSKITVTITAKKGEEAPVYQKDKEFTFTTTS